MTTGPERDNEKELWKAQKISQLQVLIQEFPAEAQLIMAALEDGLTLGPIWVASDPASEAGPGGVARS